MDLDPVLLSRLQWAWVIAWVTLAFFDFGASAMALPNGRAATEQRKEGGKSGIRLLPVSDGSIRRISCRY